MRIGPGTLYGALKRLMELGYVQETTEVPDPSNDDPRRRYSEVTPEGIRAAAEAALRMRQLVELAGAVHR